MGIRRIRSIHAARWFTRTLAGAAMLAVGGAPLGCGSSDGACDLDALLRQRAGAGAVNCGQVAVGGSTTATDQCIADQTARGGTFHAHYDVQGIDSRVALGAFRDAAGHASVLLWDSDPSGGGNAGARIIESVCGGDPPIHTSLTRPNAGAGTPVGTPVSCAVEVSSRLACGM
jgi:hypothetical protein